MMYQKNYKNYTDFVAQFLTYLTIMSTMVVGNPECNT